MLIARRKPASKSFGGAGVWGAGVCDPTKPAPRIPALAAAMGQLTFPPVTVGDMMPLEVPYALSLSLGPVPPAHRASRGY
jgi:hypothetical protein